MFLGIDLFLEKAIPSARAKPVRLYCSIQSFDLVLTLLSCKWLTFFVSINKISRNSSITFVIERSWILQVLKTNTIDLLLPKCNFTNKRSWVLQVLKCNTIDLLLVKFYFVIKRSIGALSIWFRTLHLILSLYFFSKNQKKLQLVVWSCP